MRGRRWCLASLLFDGVEHAADVEDDQYSTYEDRRYAHALGFECLAEEVEFSVTRAAKVNENNPECCQERTYNETSYSNLGQQGNMRLRAPHSLDRVWPPPCGLAPRRAVHGCARTGQNILWRHTPGNSRRNGFQTTRYPRPLPPQIVERSVDTTLMWVFGVSYRVP